MMHSLSVYIRTLTSLTAFSLSFGGFAQTTDSSSRQRSPLMRQNIVTLNFPNYTEVESYPGISVGLQYVRYLGKKRCFSGTVSVMRLIWAGTYENGEDYTYGYRANIAANLFGAGLNWHPFGRHDLEAGVLFLMGTERRIDSYRPGRDSGPIYDSSSHAVFFSPQIHFALNGLAKYQGFIVSFYGDFGPILAGNPQTKTGNYGTAGLKFGGRF